MKSIGILKNLWVIGIGTTVIAGLILRYFGFDSSFFNEEGVRNSATIIGVGNSINQNNILLATSSSTSFNTDGEKYKNIFDKSIFKLVGEIRGINTTIDRWDFLKIYAGMEGGDKGFIFDIYMESDNKIIVIFSEKESIQEQIRPKISVSCEFEKSWEKKIRSFDRHISHRFKGIIDQPSQYAVRSVALHDCTLPSTDKS